MNNHGSERVNVNFRVLEKINLSSGKVLEKSWKSLGNLFLKKGTNPDYLKCT